MMANKPFFKTILSAWSDPGVMNRPAVFRVEDDLLELWILLHVEHGLKLCGECVQRSHIASREPCFDKFWIAVIE